MEKVDPLIKYLNKMDIQTSILKFDTFNHTAYIQVRLHESRFNKTTLPSVFGESVSIIETQEGNRRINNIFNTDLRDGNPSIYPKDEMANLTTVLNENDGRFQENLFSPVLLQGDASRYPFDEYYLDLVYFFPVKDVAFRHDLQNLFTFDETVIANWDPHVVNASETRNNSQTIQNIQSYCDNLLRMEQIDARLSRSCDALRLDDEDNKIITEEQANGSFLNVRLQFQRNYTIATIVVPLLSIFFLLGTIFVFNFEDAISLVTSRLTLTLGIFALIFTLPEVINSMIPQTSGPTIADSMLSTIIIATIAFTISSVLSSSSIIRNWFPKHHTWIDGIVFLIVSGMVVIYFSNFPLDVTLWLIPIIIFGLGYGLLLRILGIRITRPLKTLFVSEGK